MTSECSTSKSIKKQLPGHPCKLYPLSAPSALNSCESRSMAFRYIESDVSTRPFLTYLIPERPPLSPDRERALTPSPATPCIIMIIRLISSIIMIIRLASAILLVGRCDPFAGRCWPRRPLAALFRTSDGIV